MALSQTSVLKLYNAVVDDVIAGVRDCFLDDGVDEQVLQELRQLWKSKLAASGATDPPQPDRPERADRAERAPPPPILQNYQKVNGGASVSKRPIAHVQPEPQTSARQSQPASGAPLALPPQPQPQQQQPGHHPAHANPGNRVPVQLTLPAQPNVPNSQPRVFTIQIPASALNGQQLHQVLTGPIISATLNMPQALAATLLQQHINSALQGHGSDYDGSGGGGAAGKSHIPFKSLDGADGSSDDEASMLGEGSGADSEPGGAEEDDDDEDDEEEVEEEEERDAGGADEEPLNSEDDVSDEEPGDMFDTDNVVVCQYDKITRSRNRWKFYLKDGIMSLAGKDYVFQKANGDAEW